MEHRKPISILETSMRRTARMVCIPFSQKSAGNSFTFSLLSLMVPHIHMHTSRLSPAVALLPSWCKSCHNVHQRNPLHHVILLHFASRRTCVSAKLSNCHMSTLKLYTTSVEKEHLRPSLSRFPPLTRQERAWIKQGGRGGGSWNDCFGGWAGDEHLGYRCFQTLPPTQPQRIKWTQARTNQTLLKQGMPARSWSCATCHEKKGTAWNACCVVNPPRPRPPKFIISHIFSPSTEDLSPKPTTARCPGRLPHHSRLDYTRPWTMAQILSKRKLLRSDAFSVSPKSGQSSSMKITEEGRQRWTA